METFIQKRTERHGEMKDAFIAMVIMLPFLFFIVWMWGWSVGYRDAKIEDRKDKANCGQNGGAKCGSIGLSRVLSLGQLSVKKKDGLM